MFNSGRDVPPISIAQIEDKENHEVEIYRQLFLRALNDNQVFLLENIDGKNESLNGFLEDLTKDLDKSISTLKLNARILKDLDLIQYGERKNPEPVRLTRHGETILKFLHRDFKEGYI